MQVTIELNNLAKSPVRKDFLAKVAKKTLAESGYAFLAKKNISLSVAIVGRQEIKRLNKVYRKKNQVTDILSFAEYRNLAQIRAVVDKSLFLGELVLCYDDIKEYAKKRGLALKKELAKVVSHGVLHLLGLQHGKKMFALQEAVIKNKI